MAAAGNNRNNNSNGKTSASTTFKEYEEPKTPRHQLSHSKINSPYKAIKFFLNYYSFLIYDMGGHNNREGMTMNDLALAGKPEEMDKNFTLKKGQVIDKVMVCHFYKLVIRMDKICGSTSEHNNVQKFRYERTFDFDKAIAIMNKFCS